MTQSPTGRLVYPHIDRLQGMIDRFKPEADDQGRRFFVLSGDYSAIGARVLAEMIRNAPGPVVLQLGQGGGQIASVLDESCLFKPVPKDYTPKMKQNGRSAEYLRHDRTKRTRR